MRAPAAALALVALTGCAGGGPAARDTAAPTTGPAATAPSTPPATGTTTGSLAYVTGDAVQVYAASGQRFVVKRLAADEEARGPVWTSDGRYVAWPYTSGAVSGIAVYDPATHRTATWSPGGGFAADVGGTADGFVFVERGDDRLGLLDPAALLAGQAAKPRYVPLDIPQPRLLTSGGRILVASGEGASQRGGPETVYEVTVDGTSRRLFTDGDDQPEGEVRNLGIGHAALTADGDRLVYSTGTAAGRCEAVLTVVVRDLRTGQALPVRPPAPPGDGTSVASAITAGGDGRVVAALTDELGGCDPPSPRQPSAAAYALSGGTWTKVADDAAWGGTDESGTLAVVTRSGDLVVGGREVAEDVEYAAWSL